MKNIPLKDYLESHTQTELAKARCVTQGAVSQWTKRESPIYVVTDLSGAVVDTWEKTTLGKAS
tara:strand:- start:181 stop:369 length:189 start_codon:yes stop_codon:yes gene_type:complete